MYRGNWATVATFPSVDEVVKTDAFSTAIWQLEPHREGMLPVAAGRGGPFNVHWEIHGDGPMKLVYSVLTIDNRGMGRSDKPMMRYSTSAMAADLLEVLDHLSWTDERQLHICGISTAIENTTSFSENMVNRITMLLPKSLDRTVTYTASNIFPAEWLAKPDDAILPDETVPRCRTPVGGWPYRRFESNYARFAAQEVTKQRDREGFTKPGFLLQVIAAGWHHKSAAQLREIGDKVGRQRILVIHGTEDRIISVPHGRKLIEYLQPGKSVVVDGMGRKYLGPGVAVIAPLAFYLSKRRTLHLKSNY
ncbi:hypothetical protein E0Z10_g7056 [Xylaria hypoxylon]|uniref:AB hydrolase-1 domain-containing protein n=1 Tax=Xylaria hypoxylon TaxID=37992 RepID=A0A4Z0YQP2_9PEZI|nr:hypothetical protein E0Z10_g7056 [Xylaria hypoxylon]